MSGVFNFQTILGIIWATTKNEKSVVIKPLISQNPYLKPQIRDKTMLRGPELH